MKCNGKCSAKLLLIFTCLMTLNIPNVVAVVARGSTLDLYVNMQRIASVNNNIYSSGQIGVAAAYATESTEVAFSNVKVWTL